MKDKIMDALAYTEQAYIDEAVDTDIRHRRGWIPWVAIAACLALVITAVFLWPRSRILYRSEDVTAEVVAPLSERLPMQSGNGTSIYVSHKEEVLFSENSVILRGTAENVREVRITYVRRMEGRPEISQSFEVFVTLFDLRISETLWSGGKVLPQVVTVGSDWSSRGGPVISQRDIEEGCECIVFARESALIQNDDWHRSSYSDLWVRTGMFIKLTQEGFYIPRSAAWMAQKLGQELFDQDCAFPAEFRESLLAMLRQLSRKHSN